VSRCCTVRMPDGTQAIVRMGGNNRPTQKDIEALWRSRWTGGDPECNHESDGEGTCLGCGAQKPHEQPR
jgi:hypothetical protein